MVTVQQVYEIINSQTKILTPVSLPILDCLGMVAAQNLYAPIDVPPFDNSAMDGYAFTFEDFKNEIPLKINHIIEAGNADLPHLKKGEAARIFTGAPLPLGADTVVLQEICKVQNNILSFSDEIKQGTHIRKQGTQTQKGSCILKEGSLLTAEYLSFLATLGFSEITVYSKPKVGIIVTGNELVKAGNTLKPGQIYESNSVTLQAVLKKMDIEIIFSQWIKDDKDELLDFVKNKLDSVDVLLFTGGISVGDYDFVKPVLDELNAEEFFYKVRQKPGKPLYFGKLNDTFLWALPGNPSSVLTCFHAYVKPFLKSISGQNLIQQKKYGILTSSFHKKSELTQFVKAHMENNKIKILDNQLSYQMDSYPNANGYAVLREGFEHFQIGEKVEFIYFENEY